MNTDHLSDQFCRVSSDLRAEQARYDSAEARQTEAEQYAAEMFEQMTNGSNIGLIDRSCWLDGMTPEQMSELFGEYLARLYAKPEPGITCDRAIIAREYLESHMKAWCQLEAEKMEEA